MAAEAAAVAAAEAAAAAAMAAAAAAAAEAAAAVAAVAAAAKSVAAAAATTTITTAAAAAVVVCLSTFPRGGGWRRGEVFPGGRTSATSALPAALPALCLTCGGSSARTMYYSSRTARGPGAAQATASHAAASTALTPAASGCATAGRQAVAEQGTSGSALTRRPRFIKAATPEDEFCNEVALRRKAQQAFASKRGSFPKQQLFKKRYQQICSSKVRELLQNQDFNT